jgi:hypothetical protein
MAKREAPEPSYDDDGNINNNSSSSSSSDEDATTLMSPPHKKSKTESLVGPGGAACVSTKNDNVVQRLSRSSDPSSSSVQQRSDERQENRDTDTAAAAAAAAGGIPMDSILTLQSAQKANEDNAQVLVRDRNDNNNAFLESTRKERIHKTNDVLSKENDNNDNAATTTKPQSLTCTVPSSSLMMNGSSTKHASSIVGQGASIGKTVLYLSLFVLNITTLIIALIVINDLSSSASYDTLYNQYMGQVQQIESSILQSRQEEMLLLSSVHKLEQDMQLILQRNVVAMEDPNDFFDPMMDGDNNTTIQSQEDKDGWLEEMRILDVERNRVMNIWSTTLDEIKKYDLLLNPYDDDTFTTPDVVINDEPPTLMDAHTAGKLGDMSALIAIATKDIKLLRVYDNNGWTPLHEAARNGHIEAVQFLIHHGGLDKVRI